MYRENPALKKPGDEKAKIWRYLDFTKFVSLLDTESLFFARADTLGDPFEGSLSKANIILRPLLYRDDKIVRTLNEVVGPFMEKMRRYTVINSWHVNDYESAAMWKLYLKTDEGVAIQSTFRALADSFSRCHDKDVLIGQVNYIDYETEWMPEGSSFYQFLHKRRSFEHERELRALVQEYPVKDGAFDWTLELFDNGAYIPVDLEMLIETIFVSPTSPDWFFQLVRSVVGKYKLDTPVKQSSLTADPVY